MESEPAIDAGFVADEQGFEAVEPGVGALNGRALAVEFGVEVVVGCGFA